MSQLPGPTHGETKLVAEGKGSQAGRQRVPPLPPRRRESAAAPSQLTSLPQETATAGEEMEVEVQTPAQDGLYEMEE